MEELLKIINNLGWFSKSLQVQILIDRQFEGFYGRASEDWETQYTFVSNQITDVQGNIVFPEIIMKSKMYEEFDDFIKRVICQIKSMQN